MYDPHRLRRNDRRYYTRKGQVIQAKVVNPPFTIEANKVEAYKEYILRNRLISRPSTPTPPPQSPVTLDSVAITNIHTEESTVIQFSSFEIIDGTLSKTLGSGLHTYFLVSYENDEYSLSIRVTSDNQLSFPFTGWYAGFSSSDPSWTDEINIWFQSNENRYFNIVLLDNSTESVSDIQLSKSQYFLPLPDPSE